MYDFKVMERRDKKKVEMQIEMQFLYLSKIVIFYFYQLRYTSIHQSIGQIPIFLVEGKAMGSARLGQMSQ